jgi:hypothetical protein
MKLAKQAVIDMKQQQDLERRKVIETVGSSVNAVRFMYQSQLVNEQKQAQLKKKKNGDLNATANF